MNIAGFWIVFGENYHTYHVGKCTEAANTKRFTETAPSEINKTWKISERSGRLEVFCNGQKMLDYRFNEGAKSGCAFQWGLDAARIKFPGASEAGSKVDTASDMYAVVPKRLISKFRIFNAKS